LVQVVPQSVFGVVQATWQWPVEQVSPALQAVPHAPQFDASLFRFTHEPVQLVCPLAQVVAHVPLVHA
jgi:hypothetical protein